MTQESRPIGFEIHRLSNMIKREINSRPVMRDAVSLTGMHGWIIGYLYRHRDEDVFQRDLESQFRIRRSTATGILQLMEKNGLIRRLPVPSDARLKKLVLTDKAISLQKGIITELDAVDNMLKSGIGEEELASFFATLDKILANLPEDDSGKCTK